MAYKQSMACFKSAWSTLLFHALAIVIYMGITCIILYASSLSSEKRHVHALPVNNRMSLSSESEKQHVDALPVNNCTWLFDKYIPSAWETEWTTQVSSLQSDVCGNTHAEKSKAWIEQHADDVLSHFRFTDSCVSKRSMLIAIEPLVGLTRHPYYCLHGEAYLVNKNYMFPATGLANASRHLFFDVGASLYDEGAGGASQKWLIEQYPNTWDGIWGWEAAPLNPVDVWRRIPASLWPVYHWYNVPVDGDGNNPLRFIRAMATRADFVVLKIDIDNSLLENAIMRELLGSTETMELVDELYFEHHVDVAPMWPYWGRIPGTSLADTYKLFGELRRRGVVAHSWV